MISVVALLALLAAPAPTTGQGGDTGEAALEAAQRCARRSDHACAARESARAVDSVDPVIAREARVVHAVALALLKTDASAEAAQAAQATAAFVKLLDVYPTWSPPPDADPRIGVAFEAARRERLRARLPTALDPGPPPEPPRPTPEQLLPLLPAVRLHLPLVERGPARFGLSLGAGVGLPSSDRIGAGLHAALDFRWLATDLVALWLQGSLALLPLNDDVLVEPGHGRGLTAYSAVVGAELRLPIAGDVEAFGALGVGFGGFGYDSPNEGSGVALAGALGVRWHANQNLALRVDAAPVVVFAEAGAGGHTAIMLRGETRF